MGRAAFRFARVPQKMHLRGVQRTWTYFGETDPLWAIVTDPSKRSNGWDLAEFFLTGEQEVGKLMSSIDALPFRLGSGRALDFGCGVGRLTQPLARHFDKVYGVDIAPTMLEHARRYNRFPERCEYVLNAGDHLRVFPDAYFDLIFSILTLQHMEPRFIRRYLREFVRVLAPGGLAVFQVPTVEELHSDRLRQAALRAWIYLYQRFVARVTRRGQPLMEMHGVPLGAVTAIVEAQGAKLLRAEPDRSAAGAWSGYRYYVTKTK
jgi:ubiquinone/menaquinone biosynthesis C-methylase UbiE